MKNIEISKNFGIYVFLSLFNFEVFLVAERNSRHGGFELTHIFARKEEREGEKARGKNRDDWMVGQDRRSRKTMRIEDKKRFALMMLFTATNERGR